jgi:hypothetical protein
MFSANRKPAIAAGQALRQLDEFAIHTITSLGEELVSLILFGDLARPGEFDSQRSEINLLLVLRNMSTKLLDSVTPALTTLRKKLHCSVMTLTEDDLRQSCDVFPVRFVDMQEHHRLLYGKDVLSTLTISDTHLRLRCEQELKNLMIRLRLRYLTEAGNERKLNDVLQENARGVLRLLAVALSLKTEFTPEDEQELLQACEQQFDLQCDVLRTLLHANAHSPADTTVDLYDQFMALVHDAAIAVDRLDSIP